MSALREQMVERVASALAEFHWGRDTWDHLPLDKKERCEDEAAVAVDALLPMIESVILDDHA